MDIAPSASTSLHVILVSWLTFPLRKFLRLYVDDDDGKKVKLFPKPAIEPHSRVFCEVQTSPTYKK
jgi:hypothetical protein